MCDSNHAGHTVMPSIFRVAARALLIPPDTQPYSCCPAKKRRFPRRANPVTATRRDGASAGALIRIYEIMILKRYCLYCRVIPEQTYW